MNKPTISIVIVRWLVALKYSEMNVFGLFRLVIRAIMQLVFHQSKLMAAEAALPHSSQQTQAHAITVSRKQI